MNKVLVSAVSAALLIGTTVSPANAWRGCGGGGFHEGLIADSGKSGGFGKRFASEPRSLLSEGWVAKDTFCLYKPSM
jgi:hypothetical protein